MKRILSACLCFAFSLLVSAQENKAFKGYLYNQEYQVYIYMNFYEKNVVVKDQEILGELPGYLGAIRDTRKWLIISADVISQNKANLEISNDYGSEDLTATLSKEKDGTYLFTQKDGSNIKIVVNRKWVKLPKSLMFVVKKDPLAAH